MTQEEKAKRYDELLLKLQKAKVDDNVCDERYCCVIDDIVPELKESEDEKIRKVLIDYFKKYKEQEECGIKTFYGIPADDILAWLEKQKEYESTDFEYVWDRTDCGELTSALDKYSEEAIINMCHAWYDKGIELERKSWLEKQGEHRQDPCKHCKMTYSTCYSFPCDEKKAFEQGKSALEAINEENADNQFCVKPVNKVEPKFKVGDWIIGKATNNEPRQISEITDQCYKSTYGGQYSFSSEDELHLWSIKDAKDGDILYTPKGLGVEGVFLVSGWQQIEGAGKTLCSYIGYRVDDDEIVEGGLGAIWWKGVKDPFFPATKEQRDKLEKAMADAGYTFDFEKKELKKIEKKSVEWSEDDEKLLELSFENLTELKGMYGEDYGKVGKCINWLKSLEGRIHPKNDYNAYKEVVESIAKMCERYDKYSHSILKDFYNNVKVKCKDAKEFDSLHPQNKCKKSLATADLENSLCDIQDGFSDTSYEYRILGKAIEFIRCTEPKLQWKPSDEQMDALDGICSYIRNKADWEISQDMVSDLYKLSEQLKKLRGEKQ